MCFCAIEYVLYRILINLIVGGCDSASQQEHPHLQVGNALVAPDMEAGNLLAKQLRATRPQAVAPVEEHQFGTSYEEAAFVVKRIKALRKKGVDYGQMACLCRCNWNQAFAANHDGVLHSIKALLTAEGIPYRTFRGRTCAPAATFDALSKTLLVQVLPSWARRAAPTQHKVFLSLTWVIALTLDCQGWRCVEHAYMHAR